MYEIHAEERQVIGRTVKTWEREIIDACMLKAAAGTTGYQGGDTGHGCRTYLRLSDIGGADMRCRLFDAHGERGVGNRLGWRCRTAYAAGSARICHSCTKGSN